MLSSTSSRHRRSVSGSPDCSRTTRRRLRSWKLRAGVEGGPGLPVEGVQVADRQLVGGFLLADVDQVLDEHAEGGAPVADVVLPDDRVPGELQHAHRASPMMVVRRWPACISLATLGDE